jgi:acyl-CoA synthetase (AMP-forming)/AMP-acid ligase II/alkylation response protein AidB-like acyl-CoA dehydrogenase/acyl carrier protein
LQLAFLDCVTLLNVLQQRALEEPPQIGWQFLVDGETQTIALTYADLDRKSRAIAATLQTAGFTNECALLLFPPGLDYIAAFFGCLYAGVIAVPAYPPRRHQSSDRVHRITEDAGVQVILTTGSLQVEIQPSLEQSPLTNIPWITTDTLADTLAAQWSQPAIAPDHLAFLQYTSGSTGTPKGVMVSHANLMHNLAQIQQFFEHSPHSRGVIWLPPYHDMGLIGGILQPLYSGFPVTLMSPVMFLQKPIRWLQAISRDQATTSGAPNFAYELCLNKITAEQRSTLDLRSWDVAFTGAEPIRQETLERFAQTFADCGFRAEAFYPCYGLAEATLIVAGGKKAALPQICQVEREAIAQNQVINASTAAPSNSLVSCGKSVSNQSIAIVDPKTCQPLPEEKVGEVWVTGKSVAQGYWHQPETTQTTFQARLDGSDDRWLRTGDLGFQQAGELYITGRLKEVLIMRGRNYYPQDIEQTAATSHPALNPLWGAAFSIDIDGSEKLVIVQEVHRRDWRSLDASAIFAAMRRSVSQQYGLQVYAIQLLKPGSIPKTSSGKIQRYRCKEEFQAQTLDSLSLWSISDNQNLVANPNINQLIQQTSQTKQPLSNSAHYSVQNSVQTDLYQAYSSRLMPNLIDWLREYAEHHLDSRLIDERRCILPHVVLDFGNQGLLGMQVPKAFGGLALGYTETMQILQQLGAIDPTLALFVGLNNVLGIRPILEYGQPDLHQELLPLLATGRELAAFALTEAEAGSHPQAIATSATLTDTGDWHLHGTKIWSGSAAWAGVINVFARQVDTDGRSLGMGGFAVRRGSVGLRQGAEAMTMGMRGMVQNTVHLDGVCVPATHQLGQTGEGMTVAQDAMMLGRLAIAAASVGGMKRCAQLMQRYSSRRSVATGNLLEHPVLLLRLNDLLCAIAAVEALVNQITISLDQDQIIPVEAYAACKISAPEFYWQAADLLVQTLGGRGYIETNLAPQILRDARVLRIFEGPTETLCGFLGSRVLHQPALLNTWLCQDLAVPEIGDRLRLAVEQIQAHPPLQPFANAITVTRWQAHLVGELATEAILWAALKAATARATPPTSTRSPDSSHLTALTWIEHRFDQRLAAALHPTPDRTVYAAAAATAAQIASFADAIGDVEQSWASTDGQMDQWLRRDQESAPDVPTQSKTALEVPLGQRDLAGSSQREMQTWLVEWLSRNLKIAIADIEPDRAFADYGIDSVTAVELAQDIQDTWKLPGELDATIAWNFPTIATLANHLTSRLPISGAKVQATDLPLAPSISPLHAPAGDSLDTLSTQDMAELLAQEIATARRRAGR